MSDIFRDNAPKYWAKGLSVIPLKPKQKRPVLDGWPQYAVKLPSVETQTEWLQNHANGNIGLVLGVQSGLVAVDVDAVDPAVQKIIYAFLPKTPWERVGKKGKVLLYKYTGNTSFRLKTASGETLVELLGNRLQVVLPPSIHPDTGAPYVSNCELVDVLDQIGPLPRDIEAVLRGALISAGVELASSARVTVTDWTPSGSRDTKMTAVAGLQARGVLRGERTLKEALDEMTAWVNTRVEKVWGDEIDIGKARKKVVEFLLRDVVGPKKTALPPGWDDELTLDDKEALGLGVIKDNQIKKSVEEITAFMEGELQKENFQPGGKNYADMVDRVLFMVGANDDLRPMDVDGILKFINDNSARRFSIPSMRREIARLGKGDVVGNDHTDLARAFIAELEIFGKVICNAGLFWQWQGASWQPLDDGDMLGKIADTLGHFPAAKKAGDHKGILDVVKNLCRGDLKQTNLVGINFVNGFLGQDLVLRPHAPEYGCTYTLPYPYLPDESRKAYKFHELLLQFWGDDADYVEKVEGLREAMAVTLFGVAPLYQKAFLLYGVPFSGKSRILEILKGIMPQNCYSTVHPSVFHDKFAPAQMQNKLMNIGGDLSERTKIEGGRFKEIVEGSEVEAQHKNKPLFRFRPMCAQWFASNHMPKTTDTSTGFTRRWLIFRFDRPVPVEKRKVDIVDQILVEEREAIVAWAVQGLGALMSRPGMMFTESVSHKNIIEQMAQENNSVRFFIVSRLQAKSLIMGQKAHEGRQATTTSVRELHSAFSSFSLVTQGVQHVGLPTFLTMLQELQNEYGFKVETMTSAEGVTTQQLRWFTLVQPKKG